MAEQLLYEDQQNNCSNNSQDIIDDNPTDDFNYKTINCQDINGGDYKSNICNISPNNNVFVGDMVSSPCYSSELECNTNSVNSASVRLENTPTSSSPASGLNPYSNSSTPGNFGESDTYSESSQDYQTDQKQVTNNLTPTQLDNDIKKEEDLVNKQDYNNGVYKNTNKVTKSYRKRVSDTTTRGRPRKALVPMYHSQISGDKNAIKIRIKKSNSIARNKKKSGKRRKQKTNSDTDMSDYEKDKKKTKNNAIDVPDDEYSNSEPQEQSYWADELPRSILHKIFQYTCTDGSLPALVRLSRVCKSWREVAVEPDLWTKVDLNWVKERFRTDIKLHSLIQERLPFCQDLNLGEWKIRDIQAALSILSINCTKLKGLNLSGWKGLSADNLKYISTEFVNLERLDLTCINSSCINAQPLVSLMQAMNDRLTHLVLAHNKLPGFTPIMTSIAENCRNLQLLDISNIKTFALKSGRLYLEKLQIGCPKLRVLRITNSHITFASATLTEQIQSPGFPLLEELSIAGVEDKTTIARTLLDDDIERILKTSRKLKLLDIRGCIKLTDSGLVRVPAWDLEHLFLSGCCITRAQDSGLELILQKWSHSLVEVDLTWSTATSSLDAAVMALAEKGDECPIQTLNLCGSSISLEPIRAVLAKCPNINSINLQSCRALPRGIKRHYTGSAVKELRDSLLEKPKTVLNENDAEQKISRETTTTTTST